MKTYLNLAGRLALIVAVVVLMLAGVNKLTADTIAEAEQAEGKAARGALLPDAEFTLLPEEDIPAEYRETVTAVYRAEKDGAFAGYCMDVTVIGYGGEVKLVVGLNGDLTVTGVKVISHSETSGIGSKAVDENGALLSQMKGKTSSGAADAVPISGATISSKAVKDGVLDALSVGEALQKGGQ